MPTAPSAERVGAMLNASETANTNLVASAVLRRTRMPLVVRRAGWATLAALLASILSLLLVPWQQSARGSGKVMARPPVDREQSIDAPISGRVLNWFVMEGS